MKNFKSTEYLYYFLDKIDLSKSEHVIAQIDLCKSKGTEALETLIVQKSEEKFYSSQLNEESKSCENSRDGVTDMFSVGNRPAAPAANSLAKRLRDFQDRLNNTRESIQVKI